MAPALSPISPILFKAILEKAGFTVDRETELNWTLIKLDSPCPVVNLPKKGALVSISIMMGIIDQIKMDNKEFFSLLEQASN